MNIYEYISRSLENLYTYMVDNRNWDYPTNIRNIPMSDDDLSEMIYYEEMAQDEIDNC